MKRLLLAAIHPARKIYWRVFRPKTAGVKVAIRQAATGDILLVRHSYGGGSWMLPGGATERGETPEHAAAREIREELGLHIGQLSLLACYESSNEGEAGQHLLVCRRKQ